MTDTTTPQRGLSELLYSLSALANPHRNEWERHEVGGKVHYTAEPTPSLKYDCAILQETYGLNLIDAQGRISTDLPGARVLQHLIESHARGEHYEVSKLITAAATVGSEGRHLPHDALEILAIPATTSVRYFTPSDLADKPNLRESLALLQHATGIDCIGPATNRYAEVMGNDALMLIPVTQTPLPVENYLMDRITEEKGILSRHEAKIVLDSHGVEKFKTGELLLQACADAGKGAVSLVTGPMHQAEETLAQLYEGMRNKGRELVPFN